MRQTIRYLLLGLAAAFVAMFAEPFFSEVLRLVGIDTSKWAGPVVTALSWIMSLEWFRLLGAGVIGMAAGVWLDNFLRRKEHRSEAIDREALAGRASEISKKISTLYGQWEAENNIEWAKNSGASDSPEDVAQGNFDRRVTLAESVDRKFQERFSENLMNEMWAVISEARKAIVIDQGDVWKIGHGARSAHDLIAAVRLLEKIAADLRTGMPDLSMSDRRRSELAANRDAERQPQSPPGTAS